MGGGTWLEVETPVRIPHWYMYTHYSQPLLTAHIRSAPTYEDVCMCVGGGGGGTGLANDAQTVQCTCYVWSTVKMFDILRAFTTHTYMYGGKQRRLEKNQRSHDLRTRVHVRSKMYACLDAGDRKHDRK